MRGALYNLIVTRPILLALALAAGLSCGLYAQRPSEVPPPPPDKPAEAAPAPPASEMQEEDQAGANASAKAGAKTDTKAAPDPGAELEEEDLSEKPRTIEFNPIEAEKDVKAGKFYLKKGTPSGLKAALSRFDEATQFNPQLAEAFFLLGETREKLKDKKGAKSAFQTYLKLAPTAPNAAEVRKRLAKLG